jgi:hypothetical protein
MISMHACGLHLKKALSLVSRDVNERSESLVELFGPYLCSKLLEKLTDYAPGRGFFAGP